MLSAADPSEAFFETVKSNLHPIFTILNHGSQGEFVDILFMKNDEIAFGKT